MLKSGWKGEQIEPIKSYEKYRQRLKNFCSMSKLSQN